MRGGLDDALEKLARRDELRRRAAGETGTSPAVTELVEAVAAVVARNPELAITMGVEGSGDPVLLHFANEDGVVQVNADSSVASRASEAAQVTPRHADFDLDAVVEPVTDPFQAQTTQQLHDTSDGGYDRYDAASQYEATGSYESSGPYDNHEPERQPSPYDSVNFDGGSYPNDYLTEPYPEHPLAATPPPPVPPQQPPPPPVPPTLTPLPEPIPLRMESVGATELAAKRLAALLREDPSLLQQSPPD